MNGDRLSRGRPHTSYHDVQVYLAGGAAPLALEQYFFERWLGAGGKRPPLPPPLPGGGDVQPRGALALGPAELGLSRTQPRAHGPAIREVERLFTDAIAGADRLIYIETQYFSSRRLREALTQRMRNARARLEIVIVLNERAEAIKEEIAVGLRQVQNVEALRAVATETGHALGCYYSNAHGAAEDGEPMPTYIHSKVMIVDDRFLTVGSANMTNRSMGIDSELHASWEARDTDPALRRGIRRVRVSLLAEHAGIKARSDLRGLVPIDGLVARLDAIAGRPDARLRSHRPPTAGQRHLLAVIDPQTLPFDSDGRETEDRAAAFEPTDHAA